MSHKIVSFLSIARDCRWLANPYFVEHETTHEHLALHKISTDYASAIARCGYSTSCFENEMTKIIILNVIDNFIEILPTFISIATNRLFV